MEISNNSVNESAGKPYIDELLFDSDNFCGKVRGNFSRSVQLTGNSIPFVPLGDFGGPKNGKLSRFFVNRRCCSTVFVRNFCIQEFTRVFFDSVSYVSMIRVEGFQKFVRYSLLLL